MAFWGAGSTKAIQALIEEVRKRPVLWNPKHALYHHRTLISDQWDEIADLLGASTILVKTKWKGLRDNFRKEVKKLIKLDKDISPWIHMRHLNFLWTVLDTTQLECDKERLQRLKDKNNAPKLTDEDTYIISHVRKIDDDAYFNSLEDTQDGSNSMDFHDYIFGEEVPVETFLETDENQEVVIIHDDEMEEDLTPIHVAPPISPPPLRIINRFNDTKTPKTYPPKLKLLNRRKSVSQQTNHSHSPKPVVVNGSGGNKKVSIQNFTDTDDSDMHFLKSILPFLKQLSPHARTRTHAQIKRIIMQELEPLDPGEIPEIDEEIKIKHEPIDDFEGDDVKPVDGVGNFKIKQEVDVKIEESESIEC